MLFLSLSLSLPPWYAGIYHIYRDHIIKCVCVCLSRKESNYQLLFWNRKLLQKNWWGGHVSLFSRLNTLQAVAKVFWSRKDFFKQA